MALFIVVGFEGMKRSDPPTAIYTGNDFTEAQAAMDEAPDNLIRFEILKDPIFTKRWVRPAVKVVPPAATEEVEVEASPMKSILGGSRTRKGKQTGAV